MFRSFFPDEYLDSAYVIDYEKLYMNMVECNAEWLYTLPQWDGIFPKEKRDELYKIQKSSKTISKFKEFRFRGYIYYRLDLSCKN